jgi:GntR family transcriptional regulator
MQIRAVPATQGVMTMTIGWNDNAPIYRQLKERVIGMMLDGLLKPGDALPSVRQVAADYQLNPITVSRAYQELVDDTLVEKRRGLGMYVTEGARDKLLASERERFIREEWPAMLERIRRLGLDVEQLLRGAQRGGQP